MSRTKSDFLTQSGRMIMDVLWRHGVLSVKEITAFLNVDKNEDKQHVYTTIQTMCKILTQKEYVSFEKKSRAFIYKVLITKQDARKTVLKSMLQQFFGGSSLSLAQHLLDENEIDFDDLENIKQDIINKKNKVVK
ncbi:MAG: BlaI/MecI/CopY family transcriptional regulator [Saccharospirillaceae bacterium]|nr:BlaI/MecI/CopY family transcriptional regulator [Pseudomonadales bacterium]NRB78471.1 BlaI/MecI/CopY family transcriptional regulator [Saccharospirillaceae bacterium]